MEDSKKKARTFGNDEGMAFREGVDVQEGIAWRWSSRVIDTTVVAKKGAQLTKIPSLGACSLGFPLYSSSNSTAIELSKRWCNRTRASPTFDDLTEKASCERPARVKIR